MTFISTRQLSGGATIHFCNFFYKYCLLSQRFVIIITNMDDLKKIISQAVITILRPLVRILIRYNISHSEFSELARRAYVETAFKDFNLPNRKNTYSRVSVITGLSRKEVMRLANLQADEPPSPHGPRNRANRVVNGWLQDADFLDSDNKPISLSLQGGEQSFEELVKRYSGGAPARAILDELLRVGTVNKLDQKTIKLNHYGYLPENSDTEMLNVFSTHVSDLLNTCDFNLSRNKSELARFQRQVTYTDIPLNMVQEFQTYSHEQLLLLILEANQWLAARNKTLTGKTDEPTFRVGLGAYFFKNSYKEV